MRQSMGHRHRRWALRVAPAAAEASLSLCCGRSACSVARRRWSVHAVCPGPPPSRDEALQGPFQAFIIIYNARIKALQGSIRPDRLLISALQGSTRPL